MRNVQIQNHSLKFLLRVLLRLLWNGFLCLDRSPEQWQYSSCDLFCPLSQYLQQSISTSCLSISMAFLSPNYFSFHPCLFHSFGQSILKAGKSSSLNICNFLNCFSLTLVKIDLFVSQDKPKKYPTSMLREDIQGPLGRSVLPKGWELQIPHTCLPFFLEHSRNQHSSKAHIPS